MMQNIRDLLTKSTASKQDRDLELALAMSAKEQVNEQKKLLEQFSRQAKARVEPPRKKRMIKADIDDDPWFQTVSTRPPKVKQEKSSEPFQFDMDSIFGDDNADEAQIISDSDSDSSIIDLVNIPDTTAQEERTPEVQQEEEDGYLSPLEGFTSLGNNATSNPFLNQLQPKPKRKRASTATTTKSKKTYKRKWTRKRKR